MAKLIYPIRTSKPPTLCFNTVSNLCPNTSTAFLRFLYPIATLFDMHSISSGMLISTAMCRKSQVNGAVNLLEDMLNKGNKIKGYNPDVVHYNTVISGFYRKGSTHDARKFIANMQNNECLPNVVLYRSLVGRLCNKRMLDEANNYMKEMLSKSFSLHFAFIHSLVKGFCNVGKIEETCGVLTKLLEHGKAPHMGN
ncbi:hypothetical protein AHAS_Ahas20G0272200 [Arachis hypogaea]